MMIKKRLVIVTIPLTYFTGGVRWALELYKMLERNYDIKILYPIAGNEPMNISKNKALKNYGITNDKIIEIPSYRIKWKAAGSILIPKASSIKKLTNAIKNTDIIYTQDVRPFNFPIIINLANRYKKKLILGIHYATLLEKPGKNSSITRKIVEPFYNSDLKKIKHFHVLNKHDLNVAKSKFPNSNVYFIPNFITLKPKMPDSRSKPNERFTVLYAASLHGIKGADILPEIIEKVLASEKDILFHIAGSGEYENIIKEIAAKYPNSIKWLKFLDSKALIKEYRKADFYILTSRIETFPLSLLEAQSFGLPAVAFDIKGTRDIIYTEKNGAVVKSFDTNAFAKVILEYYNLWRSDKRKYAKIKNEIFKITNHSFSKKKIMPELIKMLEK